jgi:hypothetical protein
MSSDNRKSRFTFKQPSKAEKKKQLRKWLKEKDERAKERGPTEDRVSMSAFRRHAEKREKVIVEGGPRPSAWTFKGTIEEVKENYVVVNSAAGYTRKTFMIEETTKIFKEDEQQISLDDLKEGMDSTARYTMKDGNMVAKWIKVTGSRFPIRL